MSLWANNNNIIDFLNIHLNYDNEQKYALCIIILCSFMYIVFYTLRTLYKTIGSIVYREKYSESVRHKLNKSSNSEEYRGYSVDTGGDDGDSKLIKFLKKYVPKLLIGSVLVCAIVYYKMYDYEHEAFDEYKKDSYKLLDEKKNELLKKKDELHDIDIKNKNMEHELVILKSENTNILKELDSKELELISKSKLISQLEVEHKLEMNNVTKEHESNLRNVHGSAIHNKISADRQRLKLEVKIAQLEANLMTMSLDLGKRQRFGEDGSFSCSSLNTSYDASDTNNNSLALSVINNNAPNPNMNNLTRYYTIPCTASRIEQYEPRGLRELKRKPSVEEIDQI